MNDNQQSRSFGSYLQDERLHRKIDLREISRKTKINIEILTLIENEDHAKLPAEVYVKGFLRAYADVLALDYNTVVARYIESRRTYEEACGIGVDSKKSMTAIRRWIVISICFIFIVIGFAILTHRTREPISHSPAIKGKASDENIIIVNEQVLPSVSSPKEDKEHHSEMVPKTYVLIIDTIEDTWIKLIIDDQGPREYSLKPKDRLTFEATKGYNILIGNSTGVHLTFDGHAVVVPGKRGQVVNIELPDAE